MTISIAFSRSRGPVTEVYFASDSRLTGGGGTLDGAQKIFPLPNLGAAISFAGSTTTSYPLIQHIAASMENFAPVKDGDYDIASITEHIANLATGILGQISDPEPRWRVDFAEDASFILGGYSYREKGIFLRRLSYDVELERFSWSQGESVDDDIVDPFSLCYVGDFRIDFDKKLTLHREQSRQCRKRGDSRGDLCGMEPLQALIELLGNSKQAEASGDRTTWRKVGGAPQLLKVYESRAVRPFAVRWGSPPQTYLLGRQLLHYEKTHYPIYDATGAQSSILYPLSYIPRANDIKPANKSK